MGIRTRTSSKGRYLRKLFPKIGLGLGLGDLRKQFPKIPTFAGCPSAVFNTMNCNCISTSESTSKLVKRLRQVFLLIKQSTIRLLTPCKKLLCSLLLVFVLFSTFSFRCSLFSFLLYFGNLFVSIFHLLKQFLIKFLLTTKNIQLIV